MKVLTGERSRTDKQFIYNGNRDQKQQISRSQSTHTIPKRDQMRDLTGAGSGMGQTVYWGNRDKKTANITIPVNSRHTKAGSNERSDWSGKRDGTNSLLGE